MDTDINSTGIQCVSQVSGTPPNTERAGVVVVGIVNLSNYILGLFDVCIGGMCARVYSLLLPQL